MRVRSKLRDATGEGPDQVFVFAADGEKLYGLWRLEGERWKSQGLAGYLEGKREPDGRVSPTLAEHPVRSDAQSRATRCASKISRPSTAVWPSAGTKTAKSPTCGDAVPPELLLELHGPKSTLDEHCRGLVPAQSPRKRKRKRRRKRGRSEASLRKGSSHRRGFRVRVAREQAGRGVKKSGSSARVPSRLRRFTSRFGSPRGGMSRRRCFRRPSARALQCQGPSREISRTVRVGATCSGMSRAPSRFGLCPAGSPKVTPMRCRALNGIG